MYKVDAHTGPACRVKSESLRTKTVAGFLVPISFASTLLNLFYFLCVLWQILSKRWVTAAGALGSLVRATKWLGGSFFRGLRTDPLRVLLPQLFRSLGCPREVLLGFLLPSPGVQHLGMTQWNLRSMSY